MAICAGAGATVLAGIRADLYLTGEMRHHEVRANEQYLRYLRYLSYVKFLDATSKGTSVIVCDHSNTERGYLNVLKEKLEKRFEGKIVVEVSKVDADPLVLV